MAITAIEAMLIRSLLDIAILEITQKVQKMSPEELTVAIVDAELESKKLMDEIDSH